MFGADMFFFFSFSSSEATGSLSQKNFQRMSASGSSGMLGRPADVIRTQFKLHFKMK